MDEVLQKHLQVIYEVLTCLFYEDLYIKTFKKILSKFNHIFAKIGLGGYSTFKISHDWFFFLQFSDCI